ncbi:MAG: fibronectin type III domain-containing protein [Candidatus Nanopelagicales bacterium]
MFSLLALFTFLVALPSKSVVRTDSCGTVFTLQNGGFESPIVSGTDNYQYFSSGTSWSSTLSSIEIWKNPTPLNQAGFAAEGLQLAELNSTGFGGLYQDITTTPGQRIFWQLKHRGRSGTESMRVLIGTTSGTTSYDANGTNYSMPGTLAIQQQSGTVLNIQDGTSGWGTWTGNYLVPTGQTTTRFLFVSFNPNSGGSGNLLDDIIFEPFLACPTTRNVTFGTPDSLNVLTSDGVTYGAGHSLSSTQNATNPSGSVGTVSSTSSTITYTPTAAGNAQTLDYTISVTSDGTTYTDESRITYNVSATVPVAPTSLSATPSGSQVVLSWTAPSNNGGVAISDYVVEFQEGSGTWQTFSDGVGNSTTATITGLTGSSNYNFRVSAKNDGSGFSGPGTTGTSAASSILSVNAWLCSDLDEFDGITGLILWLRADCVNGTPSQPSDGTSISRWEDLSGQNNDATTVSGQTNPTLQSDSDNQINGLPVLNFTRTSDSAGSVFEVANVDIRATTLPDVSIFVVYKTRRTGGLDSDILGVWGNDNGGWDRFYLAKFQNFGNDGLISLGPNSSNTSTSRVVGAGTDLTTRLLTAVYDGNVVNGTNSGPASASKIYFGGEEITAFTDSTHATNARDRLYIGWDGDGSTFRGDIAEFIVFNRALETDLPTINEYLNTRYNLELEVSTNLPDVIPVYPTATTINFPPLTLSTSTNAMICFSQVANSEGTALSGSPTIEISRSSTTSGVTENITTNLWRYNGTRANVQTQINSINISGTGGAAIASTGSKWLRVHVTSATGSASDCQDSQVNKVVEIRSLGVDTNRRITVDVN